MAEAVPIVVDLDGTLTPTDTLIEAMVRLVKQSPLNLLLMAWWLLQGRARLKAEVARRVRLNPALLPWRQPLLDWLRQEKAQGSTIVLATAAEASVAQDVAAHLGLFDAVLATRDGHNLKGRAKLASIRETVGEDFVYAGDCAADLPIWNASQGAILVGVDSRTAAHVRGAPIAREFPGNEGGLAATAKVWAKALRIHQWMKNLLLFVPMLTAFSFMKLTTLVPAMLAFLAFSLAASATYIANDIWDLDNDRAHPRKCKRPFASGRLPIARGIMVAMVAMLAGLGLAAAVSPGFLGMLVLYVVLTTAYSWTLKQYVLADVLMLAVLYTLRIVAGAVAIAVPVSSWLLAFSLFVFLSLALVKRCSELVTLAQAGKLATRGRDYRVGDLTVLWPLGLAAALAAVVVFGLFISAPETRAHYGLPQLLWLDTIALIYWLARLWIKTSRGEMDDDPVVYAVRNHGSRVTVLAMLLVMGLAHILPAEMLPALALMGGQA